MANTKKNKPKILGNDDVDFKTPAERAMYNALHPYVPDTSNTEDDDFKTPADRAKYNAKHPYVPDTSVNKNTSPQSSPQQSGKKLNPFAKPYPDILAKCYPPKPDSQSSPQQSGKKLNPFAKPYPDILTKFYPPKPDSQSSPQQPGKKLSPFSKPYPDILTKCYLPQPDSQESGKKLNPFAKPFPDILTKFYPPSDYFANPAERAKYRAQHLNESLFAQKINQNMPITKTENKKPWEKGWGNLTESIGEADLAFKKQIDSWADEQTQKIKAFNSLTPEQQEDILRPPEPDFFADPADRAKYYAQHPYVNLLSQLLIKSEPIANVGRSKLEEQKEKETGLKGSKVIAAEKQTKYWTDVNTYLIRKFNNSSPEDQKVILQYCYFLQPKPEPTIEKDDFDNPADRAKYYAQHPYVNLYDQKLIQDMPIKRVENKREEKYREKLTGLPGGADIAAANQINSWTDQQTQKIREFNSLTPEQQEGILRPQEPDNEFFANPADRAKHYAQYPYENLYAQRLNNYALTYVPHNNKIWEIEKENEAGLKGSMAIAIDKKIEELTEQQTKAIREFNSMSPEQQENIIRSQELIDGKQYVNQDYLDAYRKQYKPWAKVVVDSNGRTLGVKNNKGVMIPTPQYIASRSNSDDETNSYIPSRANLHDAVYIPISDDTGNIKYVQIPSDFIKQEEYKEPDGNSGTVYAPIPRDFTIDSDEYKNQVYYELLKHGGDVDYKNDVEAYINGSKDIVSEEEQTNIEKQMQNFTKLSNQAQHDFLYGGPLHDAAAQWLNEQDDIIHGKPNVNPGLKLLGVIGKEILGQPYKPDPKNKYALGNSFEYGSSEMSTGDTTLDNAIGAAGHVIPYAIPVGGEAGSIAKIVRAGSEEVIEKLAPWLTNQLLKKGLTGAVESIPYSLHQALRDKMAPPDAAEAALLNAGIGTATELGIELGKTAFKKVFTPEHIPIDDVPNQIANQNKALNSRIDPPNPANPVFPPAGSEEESELRKRALQAIETDRQKVIDEIKNSDFISGQKSIEAAMIMNDHLKVARATGDYSNVMDWVRTLAPKFKNLDEGLKGSAWSENSPAGALLKALGGVDVVEDAVKKSNPRMISIIDYETDNVLKNLKEIEKTSLDNVVEKLKNINPKQFGVEPTIGNMNTPNILGQPEVDATQLLKKITAKTPQEKKLLQQVASDLFNTAESPTASVNMSDAKSYSNTWNKAKNILLEQYKNNADAKKIINNYFHKGIRPTSPISQLDTARSDIGNIVRDYYMEDMDIRGELADWIAKKSGLGSKQSQSLAKSVQSTMDEFTKAQKEELIKSYFNITPKNEVAFNAVNRAKKFEPGLIPARESQIDKVMGFINRGSYTKSEIRDLIKAQNGMPVLSHNETAWIVNKIDRASRLPLGNKRSDLMGQVERFILEKRPSTLLDKANAGVDIAALALNPKALALDTAIKAMLGSMEYTSDIAQVPFDKLMETITKQRVAAFPGISKELKGGWDGVKNAFSDTFGGVRLADLKGLTPVEKFKMLQEGFLNPINTMRAANKTEIVPNIAFKNNVARTLQNIANLSKRIGNMPFYEARYNGIINQQLRLHPELNGKPTQEMMDMAEKGALESILYDTNSISDATSWIKDLPQKIGNNTVRDIAQFAMDRTLLPISLKNESNAIKRALEYSPLGLLEGGAKLAWNLKKGPLTLEKQWEIGRRLARGTVGTLGIGAGYAAKKAGIANGNANDDNDVAALKGKLSKRIPNSIAGYPYDWTLPISTPFDMGVRMAQPGKLSIPTFGMNLLKSYSDQPAYKIIQSLPGNQDDKSKGIKQRLLEAGMSYPMQYYPAVLKQAEQAGERYERETYSPNKIKASVVNPMLAQMPWLNRYLPTKVDSLGRPVPNPSPFDALINPANIPSSGSDLEEELLRLYYSTKDKKFFPKEADKTLTYWDKKNQQHTVNLTTEQFVRYQTILGQSTSKTYQSLMNNPAYKAATDQAKAKMLSEVLDQANEIVRKQMINDIQK